MAARGISISEVERQIRAQMRQMPGWEHCAGLSWTYDDPGSGQQARVEFEVKRMRKEAVRYANPAAALRELVRNQALREQTGLWLTRDAALKTVALGGFRDSLPADAARIEDARLPAGLALAAFAPAYPEGLRPIGAAEFASWQLTATELIDARRVEMLGNFQHFQSDFLEHRVRRWTDPTRIGFAVGLLPWLHAIAEHTFGEWPEGGVFVAVPDHSHLLVCPADEDSEAARDLIRSLSPSPVLPLHLLADSGWSLIDPVPALEGT